jgi:hypothetical protein
MTRRFPVFATVFAVLALAAAPAHATFHLMQVEQVIGGVGGYTSAQAIQLRMRLRGCACGSSGGVACGAGGVMAGGRGAGAGARGRGGR